MNHEISEPRIHHFEILLPYIKLYKKHWIAVTATLVLSLITLFSAIGLLSLSAWFITSAATLTTSAILLPSYLIRILSCTRMLGRWSERVVGHEATFKVLSDLRVLFFKKIAPLYPKDLRDFRSADLLNRLVTNVDHMDQFYLRCFHPMVTAIIASLLISIVFSYFNTTIALFFFIGFAFILILLPVLFFNLGGRHGLQLNQQQLNFRLKLVDWLKGYGDLVIYNAEQRTYQGLLEAQQQLLTVQKKMQKVATQSVILSTLLGNLLMIILLWIASGSHIIDSSSGALSISSSTIIILTLFLTMASFEMIVPIGAGFQYLTQTINSAQKLDEILTTKPSTIYGSLDTISLIDGEIDALSCGDIRFEAINFRYPEQYQDQLTHFNFNIEPGDKIIISGHTGSGKSTLFQLLTRQYEPQQGTIYHNEMPIQEYTQQALTSLFCLIPQRIDILSATLRNNLLLANPNATDQQLSSILVQVELNSLIETEEGLDQWLGEGGRKLSGGEERRLGIARALLHNAPIILADEPTEGLDMRTQQSILRLFERYFHGKTLIIITHRKLALNFINKYYKMENGQLHKSEMADPLNHHAPLETLDHLKDFDGHDAI